MSESCPSIDVMTTSAHPEMEEMCRWMYGRQSYTGEVRHNYHLSSVQGDMRDRRECQVRLLRGCEADLFMLTDDDDYVDAGFLERAVCCIKDGMYGELAVRMYLLSMPAYGEASTPRKYPFLTMMVFDRSTWRDALIDAIRDGTSRSILDQGQPWKIGRQIIMRGAMKDPKTSITIRKNFYSIKSFPHRDPGYNKLREWLSEDPEAFGRYVGMAKIGNCP